MTHASTSYPSNSRYLVIAVMALGIILLFIASFSGFFPGATPSSERQTIGDAAPATAQESMAMTMPKEVADHLGKLMAQVQKEPNNVSLLREIGGVFLEHQQYTQAISFFNKAVLAEPANIASRMLLGKALYLHDDVQDAAQVFADILSLQAHEPAMINLGLLYKYDLHKPEEAKLLFEKVASNPRADSALVEKAKQELAQ